jgi:hypothetical protein
MRRTISRIARRCQVLAIALVGFSALAAGCNNPCTPGETRCLGDRVLGTCVTDGDRDFAGARWDQTTCTVACREVGDSASCVSAPDPIPECEDGAEICYQNAPSTCRGGYPVRHTPCGGNSRCVVSATCGPMCALDDSPDPRCAASPFCDGDSSWASCVCDLVVARGGCDGAQMCRTTDGISRCAEASTP